MERLRIALLALVATVSSCAPVPAQKIPQNLVELKDALSTGRKPTGAQYAKMVELLAKGASHTPQANHPGNNDPTFNERDRYVYIPDGLTYEIQADGSHECVSLISQQQPGTDGPGFPAARTMPGVHVDSSGKVYRFDGTTYTEIESAAGLSPQVTANANGVTDNATAISATSIDIDGLKQQVTTKIDTVAGLATITPEDGEVVELRGYYDPKDSGGQYLRYRATGRAAITTFGGFYFAGGGADDYYEAVDKSVAWVDRFGAKPNDATFDSQPAIDAAIHSGASTLAFGPRARATYTVEATTGLLTAFLVIDWEQSGLTVLGNNAILRVKDGASIPGTVYGVLQIYARYGNTTSDIRIQDLTIDANESNNSDKNISCFYSAEVAAGDYVDRITIERCIARDTGTVPDKGAGFNYVGGGMAFRDCQATNCYTGFGWKNSTNHTEERNFEGSNLTAIDCKGAAFNWSGSSGAIGVGFANGNYVNLTSVRCAQSKVDGPWNLTVTNWTDQETENNMFAASDHRRVSINGMKAVDGGNRVSINNSPYPEGHVTLQNCSFLRCAADPTVNDVINASDDYTLRNVYIDCNSKASLRGVLLGGKGVVEDLTVENSAGLPAVWISSGAGKFYGKRIKTINSTGSYALYVQRDNVTLDDLQIDKRMSYVGVKEGQRIINTDFSTVTGVAVFGSAGQKVQFSGCRNLFNEGDIVPIIAQQDSSVADVDIGDLAHPINTTDKYAGKQVFAETTTRPLWASGKDADDPWVDSAGTAAITPN